ncbi:LytTR family transcriptional regulator DNA-binding domain-containing protein [Prevotella sp. P2-180]|uniref:LytTR family transcriptional regulator DNA-binding domain-containing protein n=1 Tax=Prevotella sp. P2-180 TaxID=2024224 RepID=UPI000B95F63E|nr:LytTR family transcriptional regulator DNA-binding domain-containing protein [Prevotella sp. P2-180]OYP67396.1 hypothetical protein CIK98_05845 [Prevotella sp. P2-180]
MDKKYILLSNSNTLIKIPIECLVCIMSDGSYSIVSLIDRTTYTFSFNLHSFEIFLESQLGLESQKFIRVGKSLIVNSEYIFSIDIQKQEIVLSDHEMRIKLHQKASKEALKELKSIIEESINKKRIKI